MYMFKEWRGFDLTKRCEKFYRALRHEPVTDPEQIPISIFMPMYPGGQVYAGLAYYEDPAVMLKYQEDGHFWHLSNVEDDTIPYFMPWFGTGVLASAFGCAVRMPTEDTLEFEPACVTHCLESPKDVAHLKMPDPYKDGLMPTVLKFIDYAVAHSDLPVGLTDMNSVLSTVLQMTGYENFFLWCYDDPAAMHELVAMVTEAFIQWTKVQKEHIGEPLNASNGLQGVWGPEGVGVWQSDDDIVAMSPALYSEFIVPHYSRIYKTFGGGSLHWCGAAPNQSRCLLDIEGLTVWNNSTMRNFDAFSKTARNLYGKLAIQIQDGNDTDQEEFMKNLLGALPGLDGLMFAGLIGDSKDPERRDIRDFARNNVRIIREVAAMKLRGELKEYEERWSE